MLTKMHYPKQGKKEKHFKDFPIVGPLLTNPPNNQTDKTTRKNTQITRIIEKS